MSLTVEESKAVMCLRAVRELTEKLHAEGIAYCHWKSNEHLEEGMIGVTDLDVLFDRSAAVPLGRILCETGYKRFAATQGRAYPGVEDYLALDTDTGKLVHLHLHYQLTVGENHLKGYHLPWESMVLSTRRYDERAGVYIADPNFELLLLLVRSVLKLRTRDRLFGLMGRRVFRGGELVELRWLKPRIQRERLIEISRSLLGQDAAVSIAEMAAGEPTLGQLVGLRRQIHPLMRLYRTFRAPEARLRRWIREALWLRAGVGKRYGFPPSAPLSRVSPRGGVLIAFLGPDGSGKSTLAKGLVKWLSWKVDTRRVYFGSGDGPSSIIRWPLKILLRIVQKVGLLKPRGSAGLVVPEPVHHAESFGHVDPESTVRVTKGGTGTSRPETPPPIRPSGKVRNALRAVWALLLAWEKRRSLRRSWKGRNRGMVMICDRYPQNQVPGFNDGPLLRQWRGEASKFLRKLGRWEGAPYAWAEAYPPDLVVKLRVSLSVAQERKPDMKLDELRRRQAAVAGLRYPTVTKTVEIDADKPFEQVILDVKRQVWEIL